MSFSVTRAPDNIRWGAGEFLWDTCPWSTTKDDYLLVVMFAHGTDVCSKAIVLLAEVVDTSLIWGSGGNEVEEMLCVVCCIEEGKDRNGRRAEMLVYLGTGVKITSKGCI